MTDKKKLTYTDLLADDAIHRAYETALEQIQAELGKSHPMFCAGKELRAASEFDVVSPFDTRILVGRFQEGGEKHAELAIAAAKEGFSSWESFDWRERAAILRRCADHLDDRKFLLSALITYECGKNRYEALAETSEAVDLIRYYVGLYEKNEGYILSMEPESSRATCRSILRPHGVFAVISPFNFPLALAAGMASAALLTGNTVILKPTSTAPWSALRLYEAFIASGVPPAAIQYITGPGELFGKTITAHRDIDGIAFTGSRDVGMWLQKTFTASQPYPKPVILEMGSKNPVIVTAHADMAKAVEGVVKAAFGYSGQKCSAASRIYVEKPVAERFMAELRDQVENLSIGDPRKKDNVISPVIDRRAVETFRDAVSRTGKDGGRIITGGNVLRGGEFDQGYYIQPTVVSGLPRNHPLFRQELFVPFVIIDTFSTLAEAVGEANATDYGLTAGIFSEQDDEVEYFFSEIRSGVIYANRQGGATTGAWPGSQSFGGWKASGSTGRGAGGPYYLLSFLREQAQTRIRSSPE